MKRCCKIEVALLLALFAAANAGAQQPPDEIPPGAIHFSYSALFGTGVYRLEDRTVATFRIPFQYRVRDAQPGKAGILLTAPLTFGAHDFDLGSIIGILFENQYATASLVPGVEFDFVVSEDWLVRANAHLGAGRDFTADESALIFGAGVTAVYAFEAWGKDARFGAEVLSAGHRPDDAKSRIITRLGTGLDIELPLARTWDGSPLFLNPHVVTYYYTNEVEFESPTADFTDLRAEYQVGIALGRRKHFRILGLAFDRLGVAYRFGEDLEAWKLFTSFPF